jgi:hypothetical protein
MYKFCSAILLTIFILPQFAVADQVVLKNGDRLTGTIVKSDGKKLVIKTEFAGEVTVQWPAIEELNSTAPLHVESKEGQRVLGPVKTEDGKLDVQTTDQGQFAISVSRRLTNRRCIPTGSMRGRVG